MVSKVTILLLAVTLALPTVVAAQKQTTFTGTVSRIAGSQLTFTTTSGTTYSVDISGASLQRKNGAPMQFTEFLVGDKIQTLGTKWADNSISASYIRDLTLYPHTTTVSGKVLAIDPTDASFTLQSTQPKTRTIKTNNLTTFKKNGGSSTFSELQIGMSASVRGMWERVDSTVLAASVQSTLRLINISISGQLTLLTNNSITVVTDNTIYGVDLTDAKIVNKKSQTIGWSGMVVGDQIKVTGKHVSGGVQITNASVKDLSR